MPKNGYQCEVTARTNQIFQIPIRSINLREWNYTSANDQAQGCYPFHQIKVKVKQFVYWELFFQHLTLELYLFDKRLHKVYLKISAFFFVNEVRFHNELSVHSQFTTVSQKNGLTDGKKDDRYDEELLMIRVIIKI